MMQDDHPGKSKSRYQRPPLDAAVLYQKEWRVQDFVGKYHLSRIKNLVPIPGTVLATERADLEAKAADVKRFEDQLEARAAQNKRMLRARAVGVAEATKLHIDAIIGSQIEATQRTLQKREDVMNRKNYFSDSAEQIKRFKKNVSLNRPHYVGYAVVSVGFRSMAWQDEDSGDSFVHMAVKNGFVELLGELLKYNGDPNLINRMGCAPLHEAWYQWIPPPNKAEQRREQEARTCDILRLLLKWNAYPDNLHKTDGNTALHIAACRGPVKAVVILLGFQADHTIRNKNNETPLDVAVAHGQTDIIKVLSNWHVMKKQAQHTDFSIVWNEFITDHEIPMSNDPDAKTTLYKLYMRESVHKMNKSLGGDYMIDDPLIQRARMEGIVADQDVPLKPWDKEYQSARSKKVKGVSMPKGRYIGEEDSRPTTSVAVSDTTAEHDVANSGSPSKFVYSKSERILDGADSHSTDLGAFKMKRRNISNLYSYLINENRPPSSTTSQPIAPSGTIADGGSMVEQSTVDLLPCDDFDDDNIIQNDSGRTASASRGGSAIRSRRLSSAHRITQDAKFELCTNRPCTSSALMLSRRKQTAPLFGTEEQKSIDRFLTSKFADRPKSPPKKENMTGSSEEMKVKDKFKRPPVTPMGAYRPVLVNEAYSENEKLYKRLQSMNYLKSKRQAEATLDALEFTMGEAVSTADAKGTMVPMVHARARSIETRVVPPRKILSNTDELNAKAKKTAAEEKSKREQEEEEERKKKKKSKTAYKLDASPSPPKKPSIKYGANRLRSAEMTTEPIQSPWSSVSATYKVHCPV